MQLFYASHIKDNWIHLGEEEARHCVQVLRKQVGDPLHIIDGKGGFYVGKIFETGKKSCVVSILESVQAFNKRPFKLHIAIAPPKNISRFEFFLEKTTEIGIDEITPLLCQRSERRQIRLDRLEKVLISAMKQSQRAYLPRLNPLTPLTNWLEATVHEGYIAHCLDDKKEVLHKNYMAGSDVTIMIGPEGDFSEEEIKMALANNFKPVTLGPHRLRTETAGIVACHTVNLMNE